MKKLKLAIYSLMLSSVFIACESETTELVEGSVTSTDQVKIGFTDTNDASIIIEDGGNITFEVSITKTLPYDLTVELELSSNDNSLISDNISEVSYDEKVVIPTGDTSISIPLNFVDDQKDDLAESYTLKVKNAYTAETLTTHFIINSDAKNSMSRSVDVYDKLPIIIETVKGNASLVLNWRGTEDLDLYLRSEQTIFLLL